MNPEEEPVVRKRRRGNRTATDDAPAYPSKASPSSPLVASPTPSLPKRKGKLIKKGDSDYLSATQLRNARKRRKSKTDSSLTPVIGESCDEPVVEASPKSSKKSFKPKKKPNKSAAFFAVKKVDFTIATPPTTPGWRTAGTIRLPLTTPSATYTSDIVTFLKSLPSNLYQSTNILRIAASSDGKVAVTLVVDEGIEIPPAVTKQLVSLPNLHSLNTTTTGGSSTQTLHGPSHCTISLDTTCPYEVRVQVPHVPLQPPTLMQLGVVVEVVREHLGELGGEVNVKEVGGGANIVGLHLLDLVGNYEGGDDECFKNSVKELGKKMRKKVGEGGEQDVVIVHEGEDTAGVGSGVSSVVWVGESMDKFEAFVKKMEGTGMKLKGGKGFQCVGAQVAFAAVMEKER